MYIVYGCDGLQYSGFVLDTMSRMGLLQTGEYLVLTFNVMPSSYTTENSSNYHIHLGIKTILRNKS